MAGGLTTAEVHNVLNAMFAPSTTYTKPTGWKLALMTTQGSDAAAGTEVTGGSYPTGGVTAAFEAAAASRQIANEGAINFTGMPAVGSPGVRAVEIVASGSRRLAQGALASPKILDAGDTLSFADGSIVISVAAST